MTAIRYRAISGVVVASVCVLALATGLYADCIGENIVDAERHATLVFTGTVAAIKPDPDGVFVTFDVHRVWKGNITRRYVLPLAVDLEDFRFVQGQTYLVFADQWSDAPRNIRRRIPIEMAPVFYVRCSPSRQLASPTERIEQLGTSHSPRN